MNALVLKKGQTKEQRSNSVPLKRKQAKSQKPGISAGRTWNDGHHREADFGSLPGFHFSRLPLLGYSTDSIQPKLTIGKPNDKYEREADAVADRIMRMPEEDVIAKKKVTGGSVGVQRKCTVCQHEEELQRKQQTPVVHKKYKECEEEQLQMKPLLMKTESNSQATASPALHSQLNNSKGSGTPLPSATNVFMSRAIGVDFSNVRIHTGSEAVKMNQGLQARAFTHGSDIYFNRGEYNPGTPEGKRLLGHELTHVVQQRDWGVPILQRQSRGSTTTTDVSPEEEFVRDLQTGTQKATEYLDYITRAVEYWRQYGTRPSRLDDALENLDRITSRVSSGLQRFNSVLDMAERALQIQRWFDEIDNFVSATRSLDFSNRESVERWAGALEELRNRSQPFVDATREWLAGLARKGSPAAARGAFFLSVLSAYAEVGVAALQAGINNVNAYFERRERIIEEAFDEGRMRRIPPEPGYPGDWVSTAEERRRAQARAEYERLARERLEQERLAREAQREFDQQVFPQLYRRNRSRIKRQIIRDLRSGRPIGRIELRSGTAELPGLPAHRWWDQFTSSGGETYFDERAGVYIVPKKERVTTAEAADEIANFQRVRPPCPYFEELYSTQLTSFLQIRIGTNR